MQRIFFANKITQIALISLKKIGNLISEFKKKVTHQVIVVARE